jgi:hypothetical protein
MHSLFTDNLVVDAEVCQAKQVDEEFAHVIGELEAQSAEDGIA